MKANPSKFQRIVSAPLRIIFILISIPLHLLRALVEWIFWVFWPIQREIERIEESRDRWKKVADNRYSELEVQKKEFERLRSSKHRLEVKYQRLLIVKRQLQKELKK